MGAERSGFVPLRRWAGLLLVLCSLIFATPAFAQDQDPLRLTVINVSERGGDAATRILVRLLESNQNVDVYDGDDVATRFDDAGITLDALRKSTSRRRARTRIKSSMRDLQLEGLMLVDVYSRGKKVQVVVLGPEGIMLADLKRSVRRGKLTRSKAVDLLKSAFEALGPEVLAFREESVRQEPPEEDKKEEETEPEKKVRPRAPKPGLKREIEVGVGMFFGRRDLSISAERPTDYSLTHGTPFFGVGGKLQAVIAALSPRSGLTVNAFAAYSPFVTQFRNAMTGEAESFDSTFFRGGGELGYLQELSSWFFFDLFVGAELIRLTVEPNRLYTGTNYVFGRGGLGLGVKFLENAKFRAHVGAIPVFTADNSAGAFGPSPLSVGLEGGARLSFSLIQGTFLELNYTFQSANSTFPDPIPDRGGPKVTTTSQEVMHTGNAMLGLRF